MNTDKIHVFIFSRQFLLLLGLELSLYLIDDMEISIATEINDDVLSKMYNLPPDVAIVDIDAPEGCGLATVRRLKQHLPTVGIIVLSSNDNEIQLFEAVKDQAAAFISKEIAPEQLVKTIRQVSHGEHPINESLITHPILADQVLIKFKELSRRSETQSFVSPLTAKEKEVLNYLAQGWQNNEIAQQAGINEQTIKNHVTSILRKLNANARTEAVVLALKRGLISI